MLQYPLEMNTGLTDFVSFQPEEYRANNSQSGKSVTNSAAPSPSGMTSIVLYMPNSTPMAGNLNSWESVDFVGPLGAAKRDLAVSTTRALMDAGSTGAGSTYVDSLKTQVQNLQNNAGGITKQMALQAGAAAMNQSPTTLLALSKGQIYNPNVELIYQGPKLRTFSFDFMFISKSFEENQRVNQIILEFKKASSPAQNGGMFEIPYVFNINYMSNNTPNQNMNRFKKSALISIGVQANPTTDMHVAHLGGAPVSTSMSLTFQEIDLVLRDDHEAVGGQGF